MYAVLNLRYRPDEYVNMTFEERAFLIACIQIKVKAEEEQRRKMKT